MNGTIRDLPRALPLAAALLLVAALAGCGIDTAQVRRCEKLLEAFEPDAASVQIIRVSGNANVPHTVTIDYRAREASGQTGEHWISCRFAGGALSRGRLRLIRVTSDRRGTLSPVALQMLRIWLRLPKTSPPISERG